MTYLGILADLWGEITHWGVRECGPDVVLFILLLLLFPVFLPVFAVADLIVYLIEGRS